jgi:hypothetical protein
MNITKDLKKIAKKTITDPIFDELYEQAIASRSNRFFQNLINSRNYELPTLQRTNQSIKA